MAALTRYSPLSLSRVLDDLDRYAIGFDNVFNRLIDNSNYTISNYPPYNLIRHSDTQYKLEMALSGYSKDNLSVYTQENKLYVEAKKEETEDTSYIHRGVARRSFVWTRVLPDDLTIEKVDFKDGLLTIDLKYNEPEPPPRKVYL